MQQRGIKGPDIDLVLQCGTPLNTDTFFLLAKDVDREICLRKREIQALERLRNCKIVLSEGMLVTCYHTTRKHQKLALRRSRQGACDAPR